MCSWFELKLEKTQLALAHTEKVLAEQKAKNQGLEGGRRSSTGTYRYGKTRRIAKKNRRSSVGGAQGGHGGRPRSLERAGGATN